jgi:hypothetical protein
LGKLTEKEMETERGVENDCDLFLKKKRAGTPQKSFASELEGVEVYYSRFCDCGHGDVRFLFFFVFFVSVHVCF